jgi:hypothetical protein
MIEALAFTREIGIDENRLPIKVPKSNFMTIEQGADVVTLGGNQDRQLNPDCLPRHIHFHLPEPWSKAHD